MAEAYSGTTSGDSTRTKERPYVNTFRVLLASIVAGAAIDLYVQTLPAHQQPEAYPTLRSTVALIDPLQTVVNSWFYGVFVFPLLWGGAWWYLSGMPLPPQLTERSYERPIKLTAIALVPFSLSSALATAGYLTNTLEPFLYDLFTGVPTVVMIITMQLLVLLIFAQFALAGFIWLDYRHLQKNTEHDLNSPSLEVLACVIGTQFFGLTALWAARRHLKNRDLMEIGGL